MTLARLYIVNLSAFAFLAWAWVNGTVQQIMAADSSHMGLVIIAVFAAGLVSAFWQTYRAQKATTQQAARATRIRSEHINLLAAALFILGLIGNAKGLADAFAHINADALGTADGAKAFGVQVLTGISSTFGATIIGSTFALWTMMNAQILYTRLALLDLELQ